MYPIPCGIRWLKPRYLASWVLKHIITLCFVGEDGIWFMEVPGYGLRPPGLL